MIFLRPYLIVRCVLMHIPREIYIRLLHVQTDILLPNLLVAFLNKFIFQTQKIVRTRNLLIVCFIHQQIMQYYQMLIISSKEGLYYITFFWILPLPRYNFELLLSYSLLQFTKFFRIMTAGTLNYTSKQSPIIAYILFLRTKVT